MTNNIWGNYFDNPPIERSENLIHIYDEYKPDVIGFQEVKDDWYETSLFPFLSKEYRFIGTEFLFHNNDRHVPIAVKKELNIVAYGFEYLTDTPDCSKAISWVVLQSLVNQTYFAICNTHFWWKKGEEHDRIRAINAQQLSDRMWQIHQKYNCPVYAMGDMNTTLDSEVFTIFANNEIIDLYDVAERRKDRCSLHGDPKRDEKGVFRGYTTIKGHVESIDHIVALKNGYTVKEYWVIEDQEALDATDHSPVYVDIEIE